MSGIRNGFALPSIVLRRIDPALNMYRFYAVEVSGSLLGGCALVRSWGRMGTVGAVRVDLYPDRGEVEAARAKLLAGKLRKGYRPHGAAAPSERRPSSVVQLRLPLFAHAAVAAAPGKPRPPIPPAGPMA